ncbi:uncharacterized protein LOC105703949 [Orussus abietinus]|uniref:uncharacterized protein LOC105703949 n=1 Tax=Orussus abietinus TaxID=222816 RepID=UPI000C715B6E|nr:uncharacterized protein LOC105703949 [Orussus abietinus]
MTPRSTGAFTMTWLLLGFFTPLEGERQKDSWLPTGEVPIYSERSIEVEPLLYEKYHGHEIEMRRQGREYSRNGDIREKKNTEYVPLTSEGSSNQVTKEDSVPGRFYSDESDKNAALLEDEKEFNDEQDERLNDIEFDDAKDDAGKLVMKKINVIDEGLEGDSQELLSEGFHNFGAIEDQVMAESKAHEEAKRVARQIRYPTRPGFFWTLGRVIFETFNDTRSAVQQINAILSNNFASETTQRPTSSNPLISSTITPASTTNGPGENNNETSTNVTQRVTTTTAAPFRLTRTELQGLIRRNLRGLVRLFNIEWRDALNQSQVSVNEFRRDLGNQIQSYLRDDPRVNQQGK